MSLFKKTAWSQLERVNCSLAQWEGHKLVGVEGTCSPVSVCGVSTLQLDIAGKFLTTFKLCLTLLLLMIASLGQIF